MNLPANPKPGPTKHSECLKRSDDFGDSVASALGGLPAVVIKKRPRTTQFFFQDRLFAFTTGRGEIIVKLPGQTVQALVDSSIVKKGAMGRRTMKEWAKVFYTGPVATKRQLDLIEQSLDFVRLHSDRR